jgi:uncharacterized protein YheU (UPF0270 family)
LQHQTTNISNLTTSFQDFTNSIPNQIDSALDSLTRTQASNIVSMASGIEGVVTTRAGELQNALESTLESLTKKVESGQDMSLQQSEDIRTLLKALQTQISGLPAKVNSMTVSERESQEKVLTMKTEESHLNNCIQMFLDLIADREGTTYGETAENIIDELANLVKQLSSGWTTESPRIAQRSRADTEPDDMINSREIKRLQDLITSSSVIDVNSKCSK